MNVPAPTTDAPAATTSSRNARSDVTTSTVRARVAQLGEALADPVVRGVAPTTGRVAHDDAAVVALGQVVLRHVEHQLDALGPCDRRSTTADRAAGARRPDGRATTVRRWPRPRCSHPR